MKTTFLTSHRTGYHGRWLGESPEVEGTPSDVITSFAKWPPIKSISLMFIRILADFCRNWEAAATEANRGPPVVAMSMEDPFFVVREWVNNRFVWVLCDFVVCGPPDITVDLHQSFRKRQPFRGQGQGGQTINTAPDALGDRGQGWELSQCTWVPSRLAWSVSNSIVSISGPFDLNDADQCFQFSEPSHLFPKTFTVLVLLCPTNVCPNCGMMHSPTYEQAFTVLWRSVSSSFAIK